MELAEMLGAGITASESFMLLAEKEPDKNSEELFNRLYKLTDDGGAVNKAMRETGVFPEYLLRMVSLGEKTGTLEKVLLSLSEYYDKQRRIRRAIRSTVGYPVVLLVIILAVFCVFAAEVLPVFDRVYAQIGAQMSPFAASFLSFGLWLRGARWWLLGAIAALAVIVVVLALVPALNERISGFFSRLFSGTALRRRISTARLANVLALCVSGTSDITEALGMARDFASGFDREDKISLCAKLAEEGNSFSESASKAGLFDPVYCKMLSIAEKAGTLDSSMANVATRTEEDMNLSLERLTSGIEPAAVIILSLLVGLLLLSVMLPLVGIMSAL